MALYIEGMTAALHFIEQPHRAGQIIIETVGTAKEKRTLEAFHAWRNATADNAAAYEAFTIIINAMEAR